MVLTLVIGASLLGVAHRAGAQPSEVRAAAAAAYNRATDAYRHGEFARAAVWYEDANSLMPSEAALLQAVRCNALAHKELLAATLALELRRLYGHEHLANETRIVEEVAQRAVRVDVVCTDCQVEIDGEREHVTSFFLAPDTRHLISARFASGRSETQILAAAGERREVRLEPPPPPEQTQPAPQPAPQVLAPPPPVVRVRIPRERRSGGLSPAVVVVGTALALGGGGVTLWSRLDTVDAAHEYNRNPTEAGYRDGVDRERRTLWLVGSTAAMAAVTTLVAIFATDWGGDDEEEEVTAPVVGAALLPEGGAHVTGGAQF